MVLAGLPASAVADIIAASSPLDEESCNALWASGAGLAAARAVLPPWTGVALCEGFDLLFGRFALPCCSLPVRLGLDPFGSDFMKSINYGWHQRFRELYDKALVKFGNDHRKVETFFTPREVGVLKSIGAKPMELYDYAEDSSDLDAETALLITAVRRDHFIVMQNSIWSEKTIKIDELPAKDAQLGGIPWLPRLIQKARGRLRGELPDNLMYCCGGDRKFFRTHDIHPADFMRFVWAVKSNEDRILRYVKGKR